MRYPWIDVNNDQFVQANEVVLTATPLTWTGSYDYEQPDRGVVDRHQRSEPEGQTTDEFIFGFDRALGTQFAVSAPATSGGTTRTSSGRIAPNWSSALRAAVQPAGTLHRAGARCDSITYYQPTSQIPSAYVYTMQPDYHRGYQGFEVSARKRMANRWTANVSYAYNNAPVHYDSANAYEDPTNISNLNGAQFAQESTSSGLGNVFVNAKWIFRLSGVYQTPLWDINVSGFYNSRSGYPFIQSIQTPSRANSAGITRSTWTRSATSACRRSRGLTSASTRASRSGAA